MQSDCRFILAVTVFLTTLNCCGCTEVDKPVQQKPQAELNPAIESLDRYYRSSPLNNGWKVLSITSQDNEVLVIVEIPPDQAQEIKRQPAENQFRIVADKACPDRREALWQILPTASRITLLPSVSGNVFIEVDCGHLTKSRTTVERH